MLQVSYENRIPEVQLTNQHLNEEINQIVDDAMLAIENSNTSLKGVLPTNYAREALNKTMPTGRDDPIAASTISADRPRHSGEIFCILLDYSVRKIASATIPVTRCRRHRIGK